MCSIPFGVRTQEGPLGDDISPNGYQAYFADACAAGMSSVGSWHLNLSI